jgi:hypothetical protein
MCRRGQERFELKSDNSEQSNKMATFSLLVYGGQRKSLDIIVNFFEAFSYLWEMFIYFLKFFIRNKKRASRPFIRVKHLIG